jgi:hypothetical protein
MTTEHPVDPQIGVRDPNAFAQALLSYKGKPGNCTALGRGLIQVHSVTTATRASAER